MGSSFPLIGGVGRAVTEGRTRSDPPSDEPSLPTLVSDIYLHFQFHLRALRQAELEFLARQTRMCESFGVDLVQGLVDRFPEFASVIGPG